MLSLFFGKAVCLMTIFNVCSMTSADDLKDEDIQRDARDRASMWFGPRLGKRAMHLAPDGDGQAVYRMLEAADALKYYYDQLQYYGAQADDPETKVTKKVIFTPKLGRNADEDQQQSVDFTPRLGRRRLKDSGLAPPDEYRTPELLDARAQYFSPRLGRGGSMTFSPRLGRNLVYDLYPASIRVARSANKTKST
uniref:Pheromone biosynthesis activating neuropeptide n=1 Tax=Plutella xylostella TaxID=51655 RepID=Q2M4G0_PLUXY|nr:pheromone biosynthesis activating neuropeptide [Plutella xylostella]